MRIGAYTLYGRFVQQPNETRRYLHKANKWLEVGERILTVTAEIDNVTDPPLVVNQIIIGPDSDRFAYYVSGGVDGEEYTITFTLTTSAGQTREMEILVNVKEIRRG